MPITLVTHIYEENAHAKFKKDLTRAEVAAAVSATIPRCPVAVDAEERLMTSAFTTPQVEYLCARFSEFNPDEKGASAEISKVLSSIAAVNRGKEDNMKMSAHFCLFVVDVQLFELEQGLQGYILQTFSGACF